MLPKNGMAFRRLRVAALLIGGLLIIDALRFLYAADNSCVEARSSALEKVNNAFNPKIDLFLKISAPLKDKGLDPNQYPIVMSDSTVKPLDLADTISKLALQKDNAVKQIEGLTNDCQKGLIAPDRIIGQGDFFSSRGVLEALPREATRVDVSEILSGTPWGVPPRSFPNLAIRFWQN